VLNNHVLAQDPFELRTERLQRPAGALVPGVRLEFNPPAAGDLECLGQKQQFGLDIYPCPRG
jgi:hypothetical protein